jgi:hypothetical protein
MKSKIVLILVSFLFIVGIFFYFKSPTFSGIFEAKDASNLLPSRMVQDFAAVISVNLDNDPEEEILVAGFGGRNRMLKLVNGKFIELDLPSLTDETGNNFAFSACDLNRDGRDEILFINHPDSAKIASSQIYQFSAGTWRSLLKENDPLIPLLNKGFAATCIDRKGDGTFGMVVSGENGKTMFLEEERGVIKDISELIGLKLSGEGRSVVGIPGITGHTNIFQGNQNGANFYFVNDGQGNFTDKAQEYGLADATFDARGAAIMDENHDELPDLIYGNHFGPSRLMRQERNGKFTEVTPAVMMREYAINSLVAQDLNLDGDEDLYGNIIRGSNLLFAGSDATWFALSIPLLKEEDMFGISTLVGDLDGKPGIEIMNTHGDGTEFPLTLYSVIPQNNWLKIHLRTKTGGIPRGSNIIIKTSMRDLMKVQSTGTGRFGEMHPDLVFGLKKKEELLSIEVMTPSGTKVQFKEHLEKNKLLDLKL